MKILIGVFVVLMPLSLIAGCGRAAPTAVPVTPSQTQVPLTATLIPPTEKPVQPTATEFALTPAQPTELPIVEDLTFEAPRGFSPLIDGTLSDDEWANAQKVELTSGELLLMSDGDYLYIGIRSELLGLGSLCVYRDDEVSVLHSSAALGTAAFVKTNSEDWERTRIFNWTNRDTSQSQKAQNARQSHLDEENWLASNGLMGDSSEMEYQISMRDGKVQLAVTYLESPGYSTAAVWPANLEDDCRNIELLQGDAPAFLMFAPEKWMTITAQPSIGGSSGGVIAYTSRQDGNMEVYVMNADRSDLHRLTNHPGEDYWPTWSPDGAQIAFASERDGNFEIYAMNADGTNLRRLTHETGNDLEPAWSPDGVQIAFMVYRDGKSDIFIMGSDGNDRQRLTDTAGDNYLPKWSPDGAQIVFVSEQDGNPEIYLMNSDGSDPRRLTDNPGDDLYPSWSPDGTQISFYSGREGYSELYVMDIDSGDLRQLTDDDAAVWVSDWSPDGSRIAFTSNRDGNREIYIMDVDSGNLERLTNNHVLDGIPAWQPQPKSTGASPGDAWTRAADGMVMLYLAGGTFQMGSTETEIEDAITLCQEHYKICNRWYYMREHPQHAVSLDAYWLDQTEVTNAQYRRCVEDGVCQEPSTCKKGEPTYSDIDKSDHPVVCVSWDDAQDYCNWSGGRLPTEAEWEYAFRGEQRLIYPWGDIFDGTKLNYCDVNCDVSHADERYDDGYTKTAPVGSYPDSASWSGVLGMGGNVSEWVADWLGDYTPEAESNPTGPLEGNENIVKGCSWFFHPAYCRGAARASVNPDTRFDYLGFRCAISVGE
jgi:TolB protein